MGMPLEMIQEGVNSVCSCCCLMKRVWILFHPDTHHPHHSNKHTRRAKLIGRVFISSLGYRVDFLCHNAARVFMRSLTGTVFIQYVLNQFAERKLLFPVDHFELPLKENKPLEGGVQMGFRTILREFLLLNECTSSVQ